MSAIDYRSRGWTDGRVERAKLLWAEGKTASEIAGELGGGYQPQCRHRQDHAPGAVGPHRGAAADA